jgi:hypothetical protein
MISHE